MYPFLYILVYILYYFLIFDKTHFYQTRRDSIVNLRQVQKLQNEYVIIMKDGTMMPLAQKKKEDFMTRLTTEFVDDMKGRKT